MSANAANINFTPFTDLVNFMPSLDAANTFFNGITVSGATSTSSGVVNVAVLPANLTTTVVVNTDTILIANIDGTTSTYSVPDISSFNALVAQVAALQTALNTLLSAMRTAGSGQ